MNHSILFHRRQRGIAVITAILIAALVASLAFALSTRERLWLRQVENRNDFSAAQAMALSAIDLARLTLRDDMRDNQVDHLLENWTTPIPPVNVEQGRVGGRLIELQGRFNLFNLQENGQPDKRGIEALEKLLRQNSLPAEWAKKLAEVMASQASLLARQRSGAALAPLPLYNLADLEEMAGIEQWKLRPLEAWVTLLPEMTPVNVNFAGPEVLAAITPGLSLAQAEQIVGQRLGGHFKSVQDFLKALPDKVRSEAKAASYTVESRYFLCETISWFGQAQAHYQGLIRRDKGKMPRLLWVERMQGQG